MELVTQADVNAMAQEIINWLGQTDNVAILAGTFFLMALAQRMLGMGMVALSTLAGGCRKVSTYITNKRGVSVEVKTPVATKGVSDFIKTVGEYMIREWPTANGVRLSIKKGWFGTKVLGGTAPNLHVHSVDIVGRMLGCTTSEIGTLSLNKRDAKHLAKCILEVRNEMQRIENEKIEGEKRFVSSLLG